MTLYPHTPYVFYLSSTALIMSPTKSLNNHIMAPSQLESLMIVDKPVVPPDSVIKTFSHLKGDRIDFVISQDHDGLAGDSMIIRNGEWAKYFLDAWFDPLYRSYNFQKAEGHALEHIVQSVFPLPVLHLLRVSNYSYYYYYSRESSSLSNSGLFSSPANPVWFCSLAQV